MRPFLLLLLPCLLLLFPLRTGWGCFDESEERDRIILFDAENLLSPGQRKYIYTGDQFNERWHQSNKIGGALNRKEWGRALGIVLDSVDFRQVLYKRTLDTALFAGEVNKLKTSQMALALFARKDLLTYLRMVRSTEEIYQFWNDPWGLTFDTEGEAVRQKMDSCLQVCLLRLQATPDAFLRARYAYQSMRLSYYLSEYQPVLELYEKYLPNEEVSAYLRREAIYYAMRSAYRLGQVARGNYLAAICFEQDTDDSEMGLFLNYTGERPLRETLRFAPDSQGKARVFALEAYRLRWHPNALIDSVVKYDPDNRSLPLLISRELNILEHDLLAPVATREYPSLYEEGYIPYYYSFVRNDETYNKNYLKDIQHARRLQQWLRSRMPRFQGGMRQFMALSLAHACYLLREPAEGRKWAKQALDGPRQDAVFRYQAEREEVLLLALVPNKSRTDETRIATLLQRQVADYWGIRQTTERESEWTLTAESSPADVFSALAISYRKMGDLPTATLLIARESQWNMEYYRWKTFSFTPMWWYMRLYARPDDAAVVQQLVKGERQPSPVQAFCLTPAIRKFRHDFTDVHGSLLLLENRLPEALAQYEKIPDGFFRTAAWGYLDEDPFVTELFQARDLSKEGKPFPRNGKKEVVRRMIALQTEAEQIPAKKAANYLLLGYAWYNMSVYGNSWMMTQRQWSSYEHYDDVDRKYGQKKPHQSQVNAPYYDARYARQCFQTAFEAAQANGQRELAAESGLCAQLMQTHPQGAYSDWSRREKEQILRNLKEYKDTKFLRHYRSTCLY